MSIYRSHLSSLYEAAKRSENREETRDDSSYLNGYQGLTGICAGFSLDTTRRVELASRAHIPITLPDRPDGRIQHYEKLLHLAVFSSIERGEDWYEIRPNWDPELVSRVHREYERIIKEAIGAAVHKRVEGKVSQITNTLKNLKTKKGEANHWIVVFSHPDERIYAHHVVYINPKKNVFADGRSCFSWIAPNCPHFLEVVGDYLRSTYEKQFPDVRIYCAKIDEVPARPLLYEQVSATIKTVAKAFRYDLRTGVGFVRDSICPPSKQKESLEYTFYSALRNSVENEDFDAFRSLIEERGHRIPEGRYYYPFEDGEISSNLYPFVDFLESKGAITYPVLTWLLLGTLKKLTNSTVVFDGAEKLLERVLGSLCRLIKQGYDPDNLKNVIDSYCYDCEKNQANKKYFRLFFKMGFFGRQNDRILLEKLVETGDLENLRMARDFGARLDLDKLYPIAKKQLHQEMIEYFEKLCPDLARKPIKKEMTAEQLNEEREARELFLSFKGKPVQVEKLKPFHPTDLEKFREEREAVTRQAREGFESERRRLTGMKYSPETIAEEEKIQINVALRKYGLDLVKERRLGHALALAQELTHYNREVIISRIIYSLIKEEHLWEAFQVMESHPEIAKGELAQALCLAFHKKGWHGLALEAAKDKLHGYYLKPLVRSIFDELLSRADFQEAERLLEEVQTLTFDDDNEFKQKLTIHVRREIERAQSQ